MTLFECEPQYREKSTIWQVFSFLPLFFFLADHHPWRWFALNIPMDLGEGGRFTGEIDIIARLSNRPRSNDWFYRTWEVKVSLLGRDGRARSLKGGKTARLMNQLRAYREFGAPEVSLLDIVVCEAGCPPSNIFHTRDMADAVVKKLPEMQTQGFGYQLLPFAHGRDADGNIGLVTISRPRDLLQRPDIPFLRPGTTGPGEEFMRLARRLDEFFEAAPRRPGKPPQIIFCRACQQLQLIRVWEDNESCPTCGANLLAQS